MTAHIRQQWVPEPLASFVMVSEDHLRNKLRICVMSARGFRNEKFDWSLANFNEGKFLSRCYEAHIRLSQEEKAVEDLLR